MSDAFREMFDNVEPGSVPSLVWTEHGIDAPRYPRPVVAVSTPGFRHDLRPDVRFVRLSTAGRWPDWLWRVFRDRRGAPEIDALLYGEWPPGIGLPLPCAVHVDEETT